MKTMSAADAKTRFGEFLDMAQREPVIVTKKNRPVGVMFSMQDIEDTVWGQRALLAREEGFIDQASSDQLIKDILNAKD